MIDWFKREIADAVKWLLQGIARIVIRVLLLLLVAVLLWFGVAYCMRLASTQ